MVEEEVEKEEGEEGEESNNLSLSSGSTPMSDTERPDSDNGGSL